MSVGGNKPKQSKQTYETVLKHYNNRYKVRRLRNHKYFIFHCLQLSVRGKNKKEKIGGLFKSITKSADGLLISGQKVDIYTL